MTLLPIWAHIWRRYKKPPPVWIHPLYLAAFGDSFLSGTGLEGGSIGTVLPAYSLAFSNMLSEKDGELEEAGFTHEEYQALESVSTALQAATDLAKRFVWVMRGGQNLVNFVKKVSKKIELMKEGDVELIPMMLCNDAVQNTILLIVEKTGETEYKLCLVNSDPRVWPALIIHLFHRQNGKVCRPAYCVHIVAIYAMPCPIYIDNHPA